MRVAIATVQVPFVRGGAEILAEDLRDALVARGHRAEIVAVPGKWYPLDSLMSYVLTCRLIDLVDAFGGPIDVLIGMKFPTYMIPHPNKVLWIIHQYRQAYELWNHQFGLINAPGGGEVRNAIEQADRQAMGESRKIFTISRNVTSRLEEYLGAESTPLYPPPRNAARFYCGEPEGYLLFPSRITLMKRHELLLEALAKTHHPVRVRCVGQGDTPEYAEEMRQRASELGVAERVEWLGWLSDSDILREYAHTLGVIFPPRDEDYGYVTLEAMLASKPVITCSDSGGPLEFVVDRETGRVAEPDADALAAAMDELWEHPEQARRWGDEGRRRYEALGIGWDYIVDHLLS